MTPHEVEAVYEALAVALDAIPDQQRALYLAKLALLLAHELGDADRACRLIEEAQTNLDVGRQPE